MATDAQGGGYPGIGSSNPASAPGSVAPGAKPVTNKPSDSTGAAGNSNKTLPNFKVLKGKASWYGGSANDSGQFANSECCASNKAAISIQIRHFKNGDGYDYLNGYWLVKAPKEQGGRVAILKQRDRGPSDTVPGAAEREFDFTPLALKEFGLTPQTFKTDVGTWTAIQVGRTPAAATKAVGLIKASGGGGPLGDVVDAIGNAGSGLLGLGGDAAGAVGDAASAIADPIAGLAGSIGDVVNFFFGKDAQKNWTRIGKVTLGILALFIGLWAFMTNTQAGQNIMKSLAAAGTVVK